MSEIHASTTNSDDNGTSIHAPALPNDIIMQDVNDQEDTKALIQDDGSGEEENEDEEDAVSVSTMIRNGGEPFETLRLKVAGLAAKVFHKKNSEVAIAQMKGGANNRVIGVTIIPKSKRFTLRWLKLFLQPHQRKSTTEPDSYVVRIPRTGVEGEDVVGAMGEDMKKEVAILNTVKSRLALPTPQVVHYDLTTDNIFERPYMIQKRLPGKNLQNQLWGELNTEQKKSVVKQVANLPSIIASVQGPAGDISVRNLYRPCDMPILTDRFSTSAFYDQPASRQASMCKPLDFLLERINFWRAYQTEHMGFCFEDLWDSFEIISHSLDKYGLLKGPCVLVHGDLQPYNLLAEIRSNNEVDITGVIDWDSAIIAPEFMAYIAPFWSWMPHEAASLTSAEEETFCLGVKPRTEAEKEIKQTFKDNASDEYKKYAFSMEAVIARRMFYILQNGIYGTWLMSEAQSLIVHYRELHPEDGIEFDDATEDEIEKARIAIAQYKAGYKD
ncbi:APH domain containing protein [Pyrenophora teres f. maculata]|nr:APH domain containing protein [Pyrenophora teres f. maculata]